MEGPFCLWPCSASTPQGWTSNVFPSLRKLLTSPLWRFKGQSESAGHMLGLTKDTFQLRHRDVQPTQSFLSPRASDKSLPFQLPCLLPSTGSFLWGSLYLLKQISRRCPSLFTNMSPHVSVLRHLLSLYITKLKQNRGENVFLLSVMICFTSR